MPIRLLGDPVLRRRAWKVADGKVDYRRAAEARRVALAEEDRAVLELAAAGHPVHEIARALHLSGRTVDRRLAGARAALGVTTTAEAVAAAFDVQSAHSDVR